MFERLNNKVINESVVKDPSGLQIGEKELFQRVVIKKVFEGFRFSALICGFESRLV